MLFLFIIWILSHHFPPLPLPLLHPPSPTSSFLISLTQLNEGGCSEEDRDGLETDDIQQIFGLPNSTSGEKMCKGKRPSKVTKTGESALFQDIIYKIIHWLIH